MEDTWITQRYELARERIREILSEKEIPSPFSDFFKKEADYLSRVAELSWEDRTLSEYEQINQLLYGNILGEHYAVSYGNPAYACRMLGSYGQVFSFLYAELSGIGCFAAEGRTEDVTILLELFLQVYGCFCQDEIPAPEQVGELLKSWAGDYCAQMVDDAVAAALDPERDFAIRLIMDSDLTEPSYLYRFGEYISANELETSRFLASLPQSEIDGMARIVVDGFVRGFENGRKDLKAKKTVNIRYHLGFERVVRSALHILEELGLRPVLYRHSVRVLTKSDKGRTGYTGAAANPQFDYDHRQDNALFFSRDFAGKKLRCLQQAYEARKKLALVYAGPILLETFGEAPFDPENCAQALRRSKVQEELSSHMMVQSSQIMNRYIRSEETSFTIAAWPLPEIGRDYTDIFREVTRVNSLDHQVYQKIQQTLIDILDSCEWVSVKGREGNETDLIVHLHELKDPAKQTNFENCLADVNIPLGEVFTSPVLAGTGGILHVSGVYLSGLYFRDLKLVFDCGQVIDYSCSNFEDEEENRRYIEDHILYHHNKIPMGEFAIGTNTAAYAMARRFGITDRLPILIAEKMGPHFAVGDTCYSYEEDHPVYNPDGKEIIARENEISALRKEDPDLAYYGCHTDITLPYDELDTICVIDDEGEETALIRGGRFVLPGTQLLNDPL